MPRKAGQKQAKRKPPPLTRKKGHASRTSFKAGTSGNPNGRPKLTPEQRQDREVLQTRARDMSPDVLDHLGEIAQGYGAPAVRAAEIIFERAWGKALTPIDLDPRDKGGGVMIMLPPTEPEPT